MRLRRCVTPSDCAISATDTPALRRLTIRRSRAALAARALRRAAMDRSRRGGDGGESLERSIVTGSVLQEAQTKTVAHLLPKRKKNHQISKMGRKHGCFKTLFRPECRGRDSSPRKTGVLPKATTCRETGILANARPMGREGERSYLPNALSVTAVV